MFLSTITIYKNKKEMAKKRKGLLNDNGSSTNETIYDKNISDFLNGEYMDYVMYVLANRAIPSMVDGLRTGARKILHAALTGPFKNGKPDKLTSLVGDTFRISLYPHGDASLYGTISEMSAFFKDNLNPLEIDGQGGTLRNVNAVAAPRYLYILLSKYAKLIYGIDWDLLEHIYDEGQYLEPKFYLPIIPTILTGCKSTIGIGYASSCFAYNPLHVIDACLFNLISGETPDIRSIQPYIRGCKPYNFKFNEDKWRWESFGDFVISGDRIDVTDLPYDVQYSGYESHLNSLQEAEFIQEWENDSVDDKICYRLYFAKGQVEKLTSNMESLIKRLKLITTVEKDNLTLLSPEQKLVYFNTCAELIPEFVKYRITIYEERKTKLVNALNEKIRQQSILAKFIELVITKKLVIANQEIDIVKHKLKEYELPESVLDLKISKITKTEYESILKKIKSLNDELQYILDTTPKQMYINDLVTLHNALEEDFK